MKISDSNKIKFVAAAFFLSGLSALMYQVIWMRKLTIIFGSTVFSVTTVITAFMFGLALGSFMAGRLIDKNKYNLFKFYGSLEIAIGAYCLLTPLMFSLVEILYGYVYGLSDLNFYLFSFVRFIVSFTILVVPTALMGATLPVLTKALVEGRQELGAKFGFLYSVNTFGAVTGTIITAFVMLPNLGLFLSLVAAVSLNILIGLFFYFMSSSFRDAGSMEAAKKKKTKEPSFLVSNKKLYNVLLLSFFVTGFAALGLEVAWFRILIMTIGNSVYAFATMLAVFLTGIALGSIIYSLVSKNIKNNLVFYALLQVLTAVLIVLLIPLFGNLPEVFLSILAGTEQSFWSYQFVNLATSVVVILPPTVLMGMSFPLMVHIAQGKDFSIGAHIGNLYSINTIGSVFGSFVTGFFILPSLGAQSSIIFLGSLYLLVALLVSFYFAMAKNFKYGLVAVAIVTLSVGTIMPQWDKTFLTSGAYLYGQVYLRSLKPDELKSKLSEVRDVIHYAEGVSGTVAVIDFTSGNRILSVNGKGIADMNRDVMVHYQLGSLPLFVHKGPSSALLLGLGSGTTLGAMASFPLKEIDVVDISAEVVRASDYFTEYNLGAVHDERVNVIVDDGRSVLAYNEKKYDVIISQVSVPWMPGASLLYTKDFYELEKSRLNPGGIAAQWIQGSGVAGDDLKGLIKSFTDVYPHVQMWTYNLGNMLLLGSNEPLEVSYDDIVHRMSIPTVKSLMDTIGFSTPLHVFGGYMMDGNDLRPLLKDATVHTYNLPRIEFTGPTMLYTTTETINYNEMVGYKPVSLLNLRDFIFPKNGSLAVPVLDLTLNFPDKWVYSAGTSGYAILNSKLDVKRVSGGGGLNKSIVPVIEFFHGSSNLAGLRSEKSAVAARQIFFKGLRGRFVIRKDDVLKDVFTPERIFNRLKSYTASVGALVRGGKSMMEDKSPFAWLLLDSGDNMIASFAWQCLGNKTYYTGNYVFIDKEDSGDDIDNLVKTLRKSVSCGI